MSGGRFAGLGVALVLGAAACGGRAEVGPGDGESGGAASSGAGGKGAGGRFPSSGGLSQGGFTAQGGQPGNGGRSGQGGQGVGGGTIIFPSGGTATGGAAPTFGGAPAAGAGGGAGCPPCRGPSNSSCSYEVCDPATRRCVPVSREGQTCDDGNFCTVGESCRGGVCQGGTRQTCGAPESECLKIECDPRGFCSKVVAQDGLACKTLSGDLCEVGARCAGGSCQPSYRDCSASVPKDPCIAGQCNAATGKCEAILLSGNSCVPADLCSPRGVCSMGKCFPQVSTDCSYLDQQCIRGVCQAGTGKCSERNEPDGTPCVHTDLCMQGGSCSQGICGGGVPVTSCTSGDGCCPSGCSGRTDSDCASSYLLSAVQRGWWNSLGDHESGNDNTFTGQLDATRYNSYFTFDLRGLASEVSGARLYLEFEKFFGTDMYEQVSVWDVAITASALESSGRGATAIFTDLQSGAIYATAYAYPAAVGTQLVISLGPAAIANINASRGGFFSVGIHVDTVSGAPTSTGEGVRFSEAAEFRTHLLELDGS